MIERQRSTPGRSQGLNTFVDHGDCDRRTLVVVKRDEINAIRSFRNLENVQLIEIGELNAYDVLCNDYVVFTQASLPGASKDGQ